jgi:hypothetical protein
MRHETLARCAEWRNQSCAYCLYGANQNRETPAHDEFDEAKESAPIDIDDELDDSLNNGETNGTSLSKSQDVCIENDSPKYHGEAGCVHASIDRSLNRFIAANSEVPGHTSGRGSRALGGKATG